MKMRLHILPIIVGLIPGFAFVSCPSDPYFEEPVETQLSSVVYEGIDGYGVNDLSDRKNSFSFRFFSDKGEASYSIKSDGEYTLQNKLKEGYRFTIVTTDDGRQITGINEDEPVLEGCVTATGPSWIEVNYRRVGMNHQTVFSDIQMKAGGSVVKRIETIHTGDMVKVYGIPAHHVDRTFVPEPYDPPVKGVPGERTIKNFLSNALMPLGTTLYIYGGAWNWQDDGSDNQSRSIGLPVEWVSFFQMNNANYQYKGTDKTKSYYPWHAYNEYHYAGADCSGFVGWILYNTFHTVNGDPGYVMGASKMATTLANNGLGTFSKDNNTANFNAGDVVTMSGHVYVVVGRAKDNSIIIVHSTVNNGSGSGVQLSAIGANGCEAFDLCQRYMKDYYPLWSSRYKPVIKPKSSYLDFSSEKWGRFSWHISSKGIADPDGYRNMTVDQILADLFGEN